MDTSWIGPVARYALAGLVGSAATIATTLWTSLGDRWIADKFNKALETHKSGLTKEVEQLKARLLHHTDRAVRANQLEYEALTEAWMQYVKAHNATLQCIVRFSSRPDLSALSAEQLDRYLETTDFSDPQKEQVRTAANKEDMFRDIENLRLINGAGTEIYNSHAILGDKGIFIPSEIEDDFIGALDSCAKAWAAEKTKFSMRGSPPQDNGLNNMITQFVENEKTIRATLKTKVRNRILAPYSVQE